MAKFDNPQCRLVGEKVISTVDFNLSIRNDDEIPKLMVKVGPKNINYLDFVKEGWRSENGKERSVEDVIEARSIEIIPKIPNKSEESWLSIDNENFELKPIRVTLLPKLINVFCTNTL